MLRGTNLIETLHPGSAMQDAHPRKRPSASSSTLFTLHFPPAAWPRATSAGQAVIANEVAGLAATVAAGLGDEFACEWQLPIC